MMSQYTHLKKKKTMVLIPYHNVNIISLNTKWVINSIYTFNHLRWAYLIKKLSTKLRNHDIINAHNHPSQWISKFTDINTVWMCNEPYDRTNFIS